MKKRVGVYITESIQRELSYLENKYKVKPGYVLSLAYKLVDKKDIERILKLRQEEG